MFRGRKPAHYRPTLIHDSVPFLRRPIALPATLIGLAALLLSLSPLLASEGLSPPSPAGAAAKTATVPLGRTAADEPIKAGKAPILIVPGSQGIVIASEDIQALNAFEELAKALAGGSRGNKPVLTVFYLKNAKADVMAELLQRVVTGSTAARGGASLGGGFGPTMDFMDGGMAGPPDDGGSGSIQVSSALRITADTRLNALIVHGKPNDLDTVEQLLEILDRKDGPEHIAVQTKPRLIRLRHTAASEVAEVVRQVYQDRLVAGTSASSGLAIGQSPFPPFFPMPGGGVPGGDMQGGGIPGAGMPGGGMAGRTRGRQTQEEPPKIAVGVDTRTNSLVVAAADELFNQVSGAGGTT